MTTKELTNLQKLNVQIQLLGIDLIEKEIAEELSLKVYKEHWQDLWIAEVFKFTRRLKKLGFEVKPENTTYVSYNEWKEAQ